MVETAASASAAPTATTGGGGTAASATSSADPSSHRPLPAAGARTASEALALPEAPGADRAAATQSRRVADVPQTDP